jgi:TetR/AcrR family transcriptional regulator
MGMCGGNMISKFYNLNIEKQERIINAAIKEFALKGYELASTNEIVKEAEISKGLLFHYFKNKKELFLFLNDYLTEFIMKEFLEKMNWDEPDFFIKWRNITLLKMELMKIHPSMFEFLLVASQEENTEIKVELEKRNSEILTTSYSKLFQNIDRSKFKDEIDIQKASQIFIWTMEGFSKQILGKTKSLPLNQINMDEVVIEMDSYINTLKYCFYK